MAQRMPARPLPACSLPTHSLPTRLIGRRRSLAVALLVTGLAVAGCSSSGGASSGSASSGTAGSGGGPSSASGGSGSGSKAKPSSSPTKSVFDPGHVTATTTVSPTSGNTGGSVVYPNVTRAEDRKIAAKVSRVKGVRTATYYPQGHTLEVYFDKDATDAARSKVSEIVKRAKAS